MSVAPPISDQLAARACADWARVVLPQLTQ